MDFITPENITSRVKASFSDCENPRLKHLMETLVRHLHEFARETSLTRAEWLYAVDFFYRAGKISDEKRSEFMGVSGTLGLTTVVEFISAPIDGRTPLNPLGPFYVEDAPSLPFNADLKGDRPGQPTLLRARVVDSQGQPIEGAMINFWQTREDGLYDVQLPDMKEYFFRGWFTTASDGRFQVRTIKPTGYTAPMDGPLGEMLIQTKRNEWRPAHWHFLIKAEGFETLVTELYPNDSPHLDDDVAFGPRKALVVDVRQENDAGKAKQLGMPCPFSSADYEFRLAPL